MEPFEAAYRGAWRRGELAERAAAARALLNPCVLCPRECGARRAEGQTGQCNTADRAVVCSHHPHFGEEPPLVGSNGSGTIFFSWCNLHCQFCQNCDLSAMGAGRPVTAAELAGMMLELQTLRCHNINLVSPSHVVPDILDALRLAVEQGLRLPLVYNTGGYDSVETLRLLDGIVDIYMPDMKYADEGVGFRLSRVRDYPEVNRAAVREMRRQVGDLAIDRRGVARRGLLVRHLVLPDGLAGTPEIARFLAEEISADTYINVMDQYRPCYKAPSMPPIDRRVTPVEFAEALRAVRAAGLHRICP